MNTIGEVFVFYYDFELFNVEQAHEAFENICKQVAPTPVIALPKGLALEGMSKTECRDLLLDMMERIT